MERGERPLILTEKNWRDITPHEVKRMLNNKDFQLVDVRELAEYEQGHIPGITLIPLSEFDSRIDEIDPNKEVVFVCRSGNRSGKVCEYLSTLGYKKLNNMVGGMIEWEGPIE